MRFDREINLKIIYALKPFIMMGWELHGLEAWRKLHNCLTPTVREIRRISPKMLKKYVMETLIFEIKENRFKLPVEDVKILCYPFLLQLVGVKLMFFDNLRCRPIPFDKLMRQLMYISYMFTRTQYSSGMWELVHRFVEKYPDEFHYININDPRYNLSPLEKDYLRKFISKKNPPKFSARAVYGVPMPDQRVEPHYVQRFMHAGVGPHGPRGRMVLFDVANASETEWMEILTGLRRPREFPPMDVDPEMGACAAANSDEEMEPIALPSGSHRE